MAPVDVDPQTYFKSSSSARFSGQNVGLALDGLKNSLAGSSGMAGSDNTGKEFGAGYDQSAKDLAASIAGLVDMSVNAAELIRASGLNHQNAQRASTEGGPPPESVSIPNNPATAVPSIPSAYGYGGKEPTGAIATAWKYIQEWVGYIWPDGDPEKLKSAALAWNAAATAIRNAGTSLDWAKNDIAGQQSPEIPAATAHLDDLKGKLDKLAGACNNIESSCNNLAQAIDDAHTQLIDELSQFAAEFVVGEIIFAAAFEIGGELWGNALMAARASVIAQRCARIIEKLIELARGAARLAKAATEAIAKVAENIKTAVAAVVKRSNVDRNADALVKYTEQALKEFDNGAIRFSPAQLARAQQDPARWYNTYKGNVLDERVKFLVDNDPALRDLVTTKQFKYGPDFVNTSSKSGVVPWYDLTTMKSWAAHAKYEATHGGPGGGIIWDAPGGVKYVPPTK